MYDAVHRALDAGAHVVLASGRSPHGMTRDRRPARPARRRAASRLWVVASNGAVVFRYPPLEVVHEETFDAAPAVAGGPRAPPRRAGRGRGARRRLPGQPALPRRRADRRDDHHRGRRHRRRAGQPRDHPRPRRHRRRLRRARRPARPARHRLRRRLDRVARPRAGRRLQGLRPGSTSPSELGVDAADVLAIGDGRNDIEMLRWAGRGVAMGQAVEEVREAADAVTDTRLRRRRRGRAGPLVRPDGARG